MILPSLKSFSNDSIEGDFILIPTAHLIIRYSCACIAPIHSTTSYAVLNCGDTSCWLSNLILVAFIMVSFVLSDGKTLDCQHIFLPQMVRLVGVLVGVDKSSGALTSIYLFFNSLFSPINKFRKKFTKYFEARTGVCIHRSLSFHLFNGMTKLSNFCHILSSHINTMLRSSNNFHG